MRNLIDLLVQLDFLGDEGMQVAKDAAELIRSIRQLTLQEAANFVREDKVPDATTPYQQQYNHTLEHTALKILQL
jgi:hypothetical protein